MSDASGQWEVRVPLGKTVHVETREKAIEEMLFHANCAKRFDLLPDVVTLRVYDEQRIVVLVPADERKAA